MDDENTHTHVAKLAELLPSSFPDHDAPPGTHNGWRIVVVDRGWVLVGICKDNSDHIRVSNSWCIRNWGTTRGLGELITGPTGETKLDWMGETDVPMRAVIFTLLVDEEAWLEVQPDGTKPKSPKRK